MLRLRNVTRPDSMTQSRHTIFNFCGRVGTAEGDTGRGGASPEWPQIPRAFVLPFPLFSVSFSPS